MTRVRVLVGTRKGAFILSSDARRSRWRVDGPHFGGWEIYHMKGSPVDPETLITLSQSLNSYLGMLRQVNGYNARKALCQRVESLFLQADDDCTKTKPNS